jgi:hypothetical protein
MSAANELKWSNGGETKWKLNRGKMSIDPEQQPVGERRWQKPMI